ncbi:MAG: SH3 domain-containing protein [Sphingobacteriales bacterium]|nr:MAG: SH3 domain-containing protein [Sphingobacteriales bacterium]
MKLFLLFILSVLFLQKTNAQQRPLFIISTTKVYSKPAYDAKTFGVYARGGTADVLHNLNDNWSRVIVENGDTGYVPTKFLVKSINARDQYEKDPADFVSPGDADAVYGSVHLFIHAASLKARAIFAKGQPVKKIFRTNEPVSVTYLPYNENKMVKVGGGIFEKEQMVFIPRKFLGRRLDFAAALKEFKTTKNTAAKKRLAERIYEMSWLENKPHNLLGVQAFRNYAKEIANETLYESLAFEEFLLKETQLAKETEDLLSLFKNNPLTYYINGKPLPISFTQKDIEQIDLPKKIITNGNDYPECGVAVTKEYRFDNFKVFHSDSDKLTYIPEINFKADDIAVSFAGLKIDNNTSEVEFIKKLGGFLSYTWLDSPHVYVLPQPDAAAFVFHFKNGKLEKMEYFFYC